MAAGALSVATLTGLVAAPANAVTPTPTVTSKPTSKPTGKPTPSPTATPWPVGVALQARVAVNGAVLTLPATDGLRDRTTVRVLAASGGKVDLDAYRGKKVVHLAARIALRKVQQGWAKTITVDAADLTTGTWRLRTKRSDLPGVWAWGTTSVRVGSGAAVHVAVRPAATVLYPYRDGVLDAAVVRVTGQDETRTAVPVVGTVRIDAGRKHLTRTLSKAGAASLPVTALPLGPATLTTTVTGPTGKKAVRRTALTLAPTAVGSLRIARSSDTVQPVVDGLLDSVVLTTSGAASGGSPAKVSGTLTVSKGSTVAQRFVVKDGKQHAFTWNGRVKGVVVPGTWTATLALKGPQGVVRTRTAKLVVTKKHLPYAVREMFTIAAGNQQGLAVRNGFFYVGYDIGNGQSKIERYDGTGMPAGTLGPLPIEHVAELAYSTTTDRIYAANGGSSTPTMVYAIDPVWDPDAPPADPSTAITQRFDLTALGVNGMVAVDDVNKRLLVFSSTAKSSGYQVSSVTLTDTPVLDANGAPVLNDDGTPKVVPAGTVTATVPVSIDGVPQGIDLVGQQLWIYTSLKKVNHVAKYDLRSNALLTASAATASSDLYWGGEGEGMATVQATDTGDGLPAWIYVGAHDLMYKKNPLAPNHIGQLVPVTDND
ncbi:hypothetical protein [Amnibacterium kyonggiense]|uniref:Uncharacterized protein n=1 Tax=Amnibacterium kyonggiense TaxID=595671 RepID=A0A4R7FEZ0_9MICO|nr:hypothetical protein [Amnibacterium kyonggiense]TDS75026.1 hypothetical protein CLV52_3550 [Amnibacterium kyonggiense]